MAEIKFIIDNFDSKNFNITDFQECLKRAKALADNTHFNPYGAYEVAKMVVMGMKELNLPLVKFIRPEWKDFDPSHPDDAKTFKWTPAKTVDTTKPAGN